MTMNKSQTPKDAASSATETANVEKKTAPASVEKAKVKKTTTKDEKKTPLKTTQQSQSSSTSSPTISAPATVIMTPREEIEARKEAKRREEESNMTFKPKLAVKKSTTKAAAGGDSSPPPTTIFTRLAESKKAVTPTTDTAPTVPKAKATPESINRLYAGASSKNKTTSVYDTIEDASTAPKAKKVSAEEAAASVQRLYAQADKLKERLEAVKIKTESEAKSECTFKPTLHSKPPTTGAAGAKVGGGDSTSAAATAGADYTQRLSIYAAEKAKKLEEARRQREKAELEECSFKPALHLSAGTKSHGILNGDGANASASTTGTSYRKVIAPEECTFKPQLVTSRHSPTGPARTAGGVSVHERLFKAGVTALKEQEEQRRRAKEEEIEKTCTFAPQMDCTSHHHSLHTNASGSATEVFERLARAKKEDLSPIKEKLELSECTFHPQVPELAGASSNRSPLPVYERLNLEASELRREAAEREALKVENELRGATFAPEINIVSTVLARKKTEEALLAAAAAQEAAAAASVPMDLEAVGVIDDEPAVAVEPVVELEAPVQKHSSPEVVSGKKGKKGKKNNSKNAHADSHANATEPSQELDAAE